MEVIGKTNCGSDSHPGYIPPERHGNHCRYRQENCRSSSHPGWTPTKKVQKITKGVSRSATITINLKRADGTSELGIYSLTNRQENCGSPNHPGSAPARLARGGGEGGIRTHGPLRDNGFRDRPNRPLSHLSAPSVQVKKLEVQKFEEKGRTSGTFHFQIFKLSDLQLVSSRSPRKNPCISSWLSCSNNPPTTSTR